MRSKKDPTQSLMMIMALVFLSGSVGERSVMAQDGSKDVFSIANQPTAEKVVRNRSRRTRSKPGTTRRRTPEYKLMDTPAPTTTEPVQIGVTVWRFRPSTPADKTKELEQVGDEANGQRMEWTLERLGANTPLSVGERIRLSIESLTRSGYLYVIDQEQYADGTLGEAKMVFPTLRTRGGYNKVEPGELIDIPAAPSYFKISPTKSGKTHVGEKITLIVSTTPLVSPAEISRQALVIPQAKVTQWEKQWGVPVTVWVDKAGVGQSMSEEEQAVGKKVAAQNERSKELTQEGEEELTQDDPTPQMLYQVITQPSAPVLVTIPLRFMR